MKHSNTTNKKKSLLVSPCQGRNITIPQTPTVNWKEGIKKYKGFTLVELIVVITILTILGTIAFVNLQGYSGSARDGSRVSDIANLSKGLEMVYIKTSSYPAPDSSFAVTYSGGTIWTQGVIGDTVMNILSVGGFKFSKKPTDPLNISTPYAYSKLSYGNAYQIKTDWEGESIVFNAPDRFAFLPPLLDGDGGSILGMPQSQASSGNPTLSYIKGNYNGMVAKTQTGSTPTYCLLAVPSIITSLTATGEVTTLTNKFLLHGQTNSGGIIYSPNTSKFPIYCSGALPSNDLEKALFASGIALAYSGTILESNPSIKSFISALGNSGTLASLGDGLLQASLGGKASTAKLLAVTTAPIPDWTTFDSNCTKPDINITVAGSQIRTWAGCNSTLGTMATTGKNLYNGTCSDYAGNATGTIACQSMTAKENWVGITTNTIYAPTQTDNIYGKLYQFDTDIKAAGKCATKTIGGQTVYGGGTDCACSTGWHIPSDAEWAQLSTTLNGGFSCESNNAWVCNGLGWMNQNGRTAANNIIKALGIPITGYCNSGSCLGRGSNAYYWSSTESAGSVLRRSFAYNYDSIYLSLGGQSLAFSVRCLKDY